MPFAIRSTPLAAAGLAAALLAACATPSSAPGGGVAPGPSAASAATVPSTSAGTAPAASAAHEAPGSAAAASNAAEENPTVSLESLGWLAGCWRGTVNQRTFREQWLPLAGGMLVGSGQTVMQGRTQDYEYLRVESRSDGIYYVNLPSGGKPDTFRFTSATRDKLSPATLFTFENVEGGYPRRIVYRRATEGWLYASVEGSIGGQARNVTYPMRRVDCETDDLIRH